MMTQKTLFLSLLLMFCGNWANAQKKQKHNKVIQWLSFAQLEKAMQQNPRYILIEVETDWCVYCKMLDKATLSKRKVAKVINQYFYAVKLNAEHPQKIRFGGQVYPFMTQGNNQGIQGLALALKVQSYPTLVVLSPDYQVVHRHNGYIKAKKLAPILEFLGAEAYKTQSWKDFISIYKKKGEKRGE
ncbi:thioredoxin fold domain-containing protein [uncultured Microscilla sp.]|uniref:thioredoxin family protein n=1 Tax=uncultured Microscilla sp. TaxID=432653 RepID=UPI00261F1B77|nr:thioredoxin fold domain-containing protein [uncultured Microscilla sp.]